MDKIIERLFTEYGFECKKRNLYESVDFYIPNGNDKVDFFLVYSVDFRNETLDINNIDKTLSLLEKNYAENDFMMKELLADNKKKQVAKNTTGIYLVKLSNMDEIKQIKNIIYALEESPYYFKRYVFIYLQKQVDDFRKYISENSFNIDDGMNNYINIDSEYVELLRSDKSDSLYAFVLRLFSKIPFTKYRFSNVRKNIDLGVSIEEKVKNENLDKYYEILKKNLDIELSQDIFKELMDSIELEEDEITNIEAEIDNLISKGV